MAVWRRWWWLSWTLTLALVGSAIAVVPESDGFGEGSNTQYDSVGMWRSETGMSCPSDCECLLPHHVKCQARPDDIHPPHLPRDTTTLILEGYQNIPFHSLANLNNLRYLRIKGSSLQDLNTLPRLPLLEQLEVTHSRLSTLSGQTLHTNIPTLTHLVVSYNLITVLNNTSLKGLNHLQVLDLRNNPLSNVHTDTFQGLDSLTILDLSSSNLSKLNHRWLVDAANLQRLLVSNASLDELPLLKGEHLVLFDASHNNILNLPDQLLSGVPKLEELFLQHNPLQHVCEQSLTGAGQLHYLDLSYTHMVNLDEYVLAKLPSLKELNLSNNEKLERVEHGAFTGLHKMERLNLAYTPKLHEIEEVAFDGLPELVTLDLRNSGLMVLPRSLDKLTNRTLILLSGTALHCDCYHYWLPKLLTQSDISLWEGLNPLECTDGQFRNVTELTELIDTLECEAPEAITSSNEWLHARGGQSALLECNVTANPPQSIIWFNAKQEVFRYNNSYNEKWTSYHIRQVERLANFNSRFEVLASGQLLIREVTRSDSGRYKCFAFNSVGNTSVVTFVGLEDTPLRNLYIESILFGFACAALFLLITLLTQFINYLMDRLGLQCCCCRDRLSPKARQIRKLLESVEGYKTQQLDRLRENYNAQVATIKDSCYLQMERIRESYGGQTKHLKDLRDYSTQGLTSVRDQYLDQVNKVRDYSVSQMNRVRENYVFQRHRIRKFSAQQLLKLRETYKYQQKTLNKILENLPDLYLQNCRTGGCQRSDSILFDDALNGIDAYYKVDFFDTQSHGSDYYTPASTLTRSFRASRANDPSKRHSRTSSNTSSDFMEAQTWIHRESASMGSNSPAHPNPPHFRGHNRSMSMATPASYVPEPVRVHKRSFSATHPTRRVVPAPELRGVPARITLCEEVSDYDLATPPTSPSSQPGRPVAPPSVTSTLVKTNEHQEPLHAASQEEVEINIDMADDEPSVHMPSSTLGKSISDSIVEKQANDSDKPHSEDETLLSTVPGDSSSGSTSYETSL
ncbi:immunoglobulin domain and leucine-rich repeat-containing protein 2 [Palaemon carinicauda]|uniref:immunoglobulin domain and leucine-rich repeat-containing protein 2 n=1 Tax=Palaemon carinicauda TaxID=392227 RepID=UPI0035B6686C